jgi:pimeloyl-ACP methyl ester carboxylesterase
LSLVRAPTLLIVGGDDEAVIELNEDARRQMDTVVRIEVVPGATHLFEERGKLEEVQRLAIEWFRRYLSRHAGRKGPVDMLDGVAPGEE